MANLLELFEPSTRSWTRPVYNLPGKSPRDLSIRTIHTSKPEPQPETQIKNESIDTVFSIRDWITASLAATPSSQSTPSDSYDGRDEDNTSTSSNSTPDPDSPTTKYSHINLDQEIHYDPLETDNALEAVPSRTSITLLSSDIRLYDEPQASVRLKLFKKKKTYRKTGKWPRQESTIRSRSKSPQVVSTQPLESPFVLRQASSDSEIEVEDDIAGGFSVPVSPRNSWDVDQQKSICVLRRFYTNSWRDLAAVFNKHFENHLRAHGFDAFPQSSVVVQYYDLRRFNRPAFRTIYDIEFERASSENNELCEALENTAEIIGIELYPKIAEDEEEREGFPQNPPQEIHQAEETQRTPSTPREPILLSSIPQELLTTTLPPLDEDNQQDTSSPPQPVIDFPAVFFRCYSEASAGSNTRTGFCAGFFQSFPSDAIPDPITEADTLFNLFGAHHVLGHNSLSPFISITDSFLWALHKALWTKDRHPATSPRISVLNAALMPGPVFPGRRVVPELRRCGLLRELRGFRAKYKGQCEYFVWATIDSGAIVADVGLEDIVSLAQGYPGVGDVLRLDVLRASRSLRFARRKFLLNRLRLRGDVEAAIGHLASALGVGPETAGPVISAVVYNIVQGWALGVEGFDTGAVK
ncbi:hypothetical protein M501DRAFT_991486 [Patellaria atrata CBS 101060]|uniref:DUF7587 domain-containing protein n=1 Tax=Patellaria atrata CBS 101060 TaxID=1346257 RepID=A0A9P4SD32_9PEZI|nr:hypothetical protein M501DRAFT_991486 [Patellaria atrata CBS 101060]